MIGLAGEIGCQAGSAITELAGGADSDAVAAEHVDDCFTHRYFVLDAGAHEPDAEWPVVLDDLGRWGREIFVMHRIRRPLRGGLAPRPPPPGGAAKKEICFLGGGAAHREQIR